MFSWLQRIQQKKINLDIFAYENNLGLPKDLVGAKVKIQKDKTI